MLKLDRETAAFLAGIPADDLYPIVSRDGVVVSPMLAAALSGLSPRRINEAIAERRIPARRVGSHRYICPGDLAHLAGVRSYSLNHWATAFRKARAGSGDAEAVF